VRILILAGWYPNSNNSIKGVFVREQARALAAAGLSVAVFYPFDEEIAPNKVESSTEHGFTVYRANTYGSGNRYLSRLVSYYTAQKKLKEVVERFRPELIHVHVGYPAGIIAYLFTRLNKIPYGITEHMSYLKDYVDKFHHRILLRPAFEQAARVLPVSDALAEQIKSFGWKVKLQPVPNVVDTERFSLATTQDVDSTVTQNQINLLFAGSMEDTQVKGVNYLLPAFAIVLKKFPEKKLHLNLVGDGSKRQDYEKLSKALGIKGHCTFHGRVSPDQMPQFYQNADALVVSSMKETFGCVLIEAMACGKPVVATACGGPEGIVNPRVGVLVQPRSTEELARGLTQVISNLENYNPDEIRHYAIEKYSLQAIAKTLSNIYAEILA
jgi:glycosyltransferase involved in cell wall biosynthesis